MTDHTTFSSDEWLRYTRHIQLPQIGPEGQTRLKQSTVLIVGCGGLGSPVALYLAAAGVGHIVLVDGDSVDVTNLQRQILFDTDAVGQSKSLVGKAKLNALNPEIKITAITDSLTLENAPSLIEQSDLILDCTDNFATRYLINDTCAKFKKPWVFASIHQFSGQCALFTPETACFRCLFPDTPTEVPDCNAAGVLGVLPGMLGLFQANEAIKYLTGLATPLKNTLLLIEAIDLTFRKIKLSKANDCVICQTHKPPEQLQSYYQHICQSESIDENQISPQQFESIKDDTDSLVLDVRTEAERAAFHIGGLHIPLSNVEENLEQLNKKKTIICYCQSGIRSLKACQLLQHLGFKSVSLNSGLSGLLKSRIKP